MQSLRWPMLGGCGRGAPPDRPRSIRWTSRVLLGLALLSLLPTGCASMRNPCAEPMFSRCNPFRPGGLFRRNTVIATPMVTDGCAEPFLSVPADAVPMYSPAEVLPAPAIDLAPPGETQVLEPITPTSSRSTPERKTTYETLKPPSGTITSRPGGPGSPESRSESSLAADPSAPLLDLPPLAATTLEDVEDSPPTPPAAEDLTIVRNTVPTDLTTPVAAQPELPPRPADSGPISLAPGIARFKVVEPQLAGGSLPNAAGWSFLAEKGYRTVLDLRARSEVQPGDDAAAQHAGLEYVAFPMTPDSINDELLERFDDAISRAGNRPLYFFDEDGGRPCILWFLKRVRTDGVDTKVAARDSEELGPKVAEYWLAANVYLQQKQAEAALTPAPTSAPAPVELPAAPPLEPLPRAEPAEDVPPPAEPAPEASIPTLTPVAFGVGAIDETTWRPVAAMILTGLSLPLAFLGRNVFSVRVARRLASLSAPGRSRAALPPKSDA